MDQHTKSRNTLLEGTLSDMLTQDNRTFVEMVAEMKPLLSTAYYCQQKGPFTNYVMHFSPLFDHPPTYGYVFAMILLNIYLMKFAMVIFC